MLKQNKTKITQNAFRQNFFSGCNHKCLNRNPKFPHLQPPKISLSLSFLIALFTPTPSPCFGQKILNTSPHTRTRLAPICTALFLIYKLTSFFLRLISIALLPPFLLKSTHGFAPLLKCLWQYLITMILYRCSFFFSVKSYHVNTHTHTH